MTPQAYCRQQAAQSGSSFYYSFLFLPPTQRDTIMALYAFCRAVDDVVDNATDPSIAATKLNWWRAEVGRVFAGDSANPPSHPIALALQAQVQAFGIKETELLEIIAGMEMDLHQARYVDDEALSVYCWRVAGVVGVLSARIFSGYSVSMSSSEKDALHTYATHMGQALQRINIIRDVGEDALRGRVYLPQSLLVAHGLTHQDVLARKPSAALNSVLKNSAQMAREHLRLALDALPKSQVRAQRSGLIMARVYASLLLEIEGSDFAVLNQRISLTPVRKLLLAWKTWVAPQAAMRALHTLARAN